jgi:nucleotide-binding universal stress UspA family protein
MHDELQAAADVVENFTGAQPRLFRRVLITAGDEESRRDMAALAASIAGSAERVSAPDRADLIVSDSARDIEGAPCPVAVAPRGFASRADRGLRRIDVGIDGSRGAGAALATALWIALDHDARLRLLAIAAPRSGAVDSDSGETARLARHLERASERLSAVRVETELREGPVDRVLVELSAASDLLLLGSRGTYDAVGRVALGELGESILSAATCPVLVIPAP